MPLVVALGIMVLVLCCCETGMKLFLAPIKHSSHFQTQLLNRTSSSHLKDSPNPNNPCLCLFGTHRHFMVTINPFLEALLLPSEAACACRFHRWNTAVGGSLLAKDQAGLRSETFSKTKQRKEVPS